MFLAILLFEAAAATSVPCADSSSCAGEPLTLPQLVATALRRNLRGVDAGLAIEEKEHSQRSAYSSFFPTLDINYTASWYRYMQGSYIGSFSAALPSLDPFSNYSATVSVTQPIFSGGKPTSDYSRAKLSVAHSALQYEVDRQNLILDVTTAYYRLVQAETLLKVANASIVALDAVLKRAKNLFKEGMNFHVDVLAAEGQIAQARSARIKALADIDKATASLNFLLRNPQRTPIKVVHDFDYRPHPYKEPATFSIALANRSETRQADIDIRRAEMQVKSVSADLLPNIKLQVQGIRTNGDWNVFDPHADNDWSLQGIFSWSFDMFHKRETVKEQRVAYARAVVKKEQLLEQIMEDVAKAYTDVKRAESDIANNRAAVRYRKENFRINRSRYDEKMATYVEVLEAERQLFQAEADYYGSLIEYRLNLAVLERKMGVLR